MSPEVLHYIAEIVTGLGAIAGAYVATAKGIRLEVQKLVDARLEARVKPEALKQLEEVRSDA